MLLAMLAQDLSTISLAIFENGNVERQKDVAAAPERYLQSLDETLRSWKVSLHQLEGVIVVIGSGSFTSSRVSTTMANALAFTHRWPLFALENRARLPLAELLESFVPSAEKSVSFAFPAYDGEAHITHPV